MKPRLAPLLALLLFGSCEGSPLYRESLELLLPELPEAWRGLEGIVFLVSYRGAEGCQRELRAPPGARLRIELERGRPQALLARPLWGRAKLRPAGAFYPSVAGSSGEASAIPGPAWPSLLGGGRLALEWRGGWLASVHRALEEAGRDPSAFDLPRLGREAEARLSEPWSQDPRELAAALISGAFRADRLREPPRFPLLLPGEGPWAPESPLAPPPEAAPSGSLVEISPGLHRFYGEEGELAALVFEDGSAYLIASP